jgi:YVTN family beta-propeller protein
VRSLVLLAVVVAVACCPALALAAPPALTPSQVGEPANGGGVFRFPQAVAFSPGGSRVFVGDQYSGDVQAFAADGTFEFSFGSRSVRRETGRLGVVGGVATDRSGHVYVLDSENDRVQIFDLDGHFIRAFGDSTTFDLASGTPNVNGGISASGLAVVQPDPSASPVVYVADQGRDQVDRFVLDPSTLAVTSTTTRADLGLDHPQGIALDPAATRVYVADDDNHRVLVLDPTSLSVIAQVGSFGTGPGQFQNPYDVAVDTHDQLYVADNLNNRVDVFDATSLASLGAFGTAGHAIGQFSIVRAAGALADDPRGGVDVADTANNRIQALDPGGSLLSAWGLAGRGVGYVTRARGVALDPSGGVTVADTFDHRVERFDPDGTYGVQFGLVSQSTGFAFAGPVTGQFDTPSGVAYDDAGHLWVADTGNDRVVAIDPADGAVLFTSPAGAFSAPRDVAAGPAGGVLVADTGNGRVATIAPGGAITTLRDGLANPTAVSSDGGAGAYATDDTHVVHVPDAVAPVQDVAAPGGGTTWDHPDGVVYDPQADTLYVAERRLATPNGARVVRGVRSAGVFAWDTIADEGAGDRQVIEPANLALSADGGTLLVADAGNNRILRFDAPGHAAPVTPPLNVSIDGFTRGTVTSAPAGIACATDCVQHYGTGRQVTLSATAFGGNVFSGWTGDCAPAGAAPTCTVTMDAARSAGATFSPAPPPAPPAAAAPAVSAPPVAVRIASLRFSTHHLRLARRADRRRHHRARKATRARISLRLTQPATVTLRVQVARPGRRRGSQCVAFHSPRARANCRRYVTVAGHRTLKLRAGTNTFTLSTVWNRRSLRPGSYRLTVVALDAHGNRVGPVAGLFTVAR